MIPKCCCGTCIIGQDKFSLNDGKPHSGWTARDSIWGTAGGDEATNSGGVYDFPKPGMQKFNTAHPDGASGTQHVKVRFKLHETTTGNGAVAAVIVGYQDDTHYLVARVVKGSSGDCDYLEVWKFDAGSSNGYYSACDGDGNANNSTTIPVRNLTLDEWHTLDVCLMPNVYGTYSTGDRIRAKLTLADGTTWGVQGIADSYTTGAYVGLASEYSDLGTNTLYGEVYFDDFEFTYFRDTSTHKSCPNCNGPCHIFDDDFDDYSSASDNVLGCFWSATQSPATGTARFDGTYLQCDSGSRIKCLVPHPTSKSSKIITVTFLWEASKQVRVDTGSGYAIFDSANQWIKLYDNDGTLLATSAASLPAYDDAIHTAEVCYEGGAITATMDSICVDAASTDTGDSFVYLGSTSGTVKFASFDLKKHKDTEEPKDEGCTACECQITCDNCDGGFSPSLWKLVIPADISNGGTCANCPNSAGTYIIGGITPPSGDCSWQGTDLLDVSCTFNIDLWMVLAGPGDSTYPGTTYRMYVFMRSQTFPDPSIIWMRDYGLTKPDCLNFLDEEIELSSNVGGGCTSGGLPVLLTAV